MVTYTEKNPVIEFDSSRVVTFTVKKYVKEEDSSRVFNAHKHFKGLVACTEKPVNEDF